MKLLVVTQDLLVEMTDEPDWVVDFAVKKAITEEREKLDTEQAKKKKLEERLKRSKEKSLTGAGQPATLFRKRRKVCFSYHVCSCDSFSTHFFFFAGAFGVQPTGSADSDDDDDKVSKRSKMQREGGEGGDDDEGLIVEDYQSDGEENPQAKIKHISLAHILGEDEDEEQALKRQEEEEYQQRKIFYCSRTHSQLAQFIREVKKTEYAKKIRCVSLGSRKKYSSFLRIFLNPPV